MTTTDRLEIPELPKLVGSEKQVAWAESVRSKHVARWTDYISRLVAEAPSDLNVRAQLEVFAPARAEWLRANYWGETSASKWIDRRLVDVLDAAKQGTRGQVTAAFFARLDELEAAKS